jgi:hypothetical protein
MSRVGIPGNPSVVISTGYSPTLLSVCYPWTFSCLRGSCIFAGQHVFVGPVGVEPTLART